MAKGSLIAHKPPRNWSDRDRDQALFDIARFGRRFREAEAIAVVRQRRSHTEALALVVGLDPSTPALLTSFELTEPERKEADALAGRPRIALHWNGARVAIPWMDYPELEQSANTLLPAGAVLAPPGLECDDFGLLGNCRWS
jgi:hypothetical protein